jgi:hypothetical protein
VDGRRGAEMLGNRMEKLLASHVAVGWSMLQSRKVLGMATDKGSINCLSLQNSVIFSASSQAVLTCPQAQPDNGH